MAGLVVASAFFSSSEAALFSLDSRDRRRLATAGQAGRTAHALLSDSDRLLTAVLFWNLVANLTYFTIASVVSLRLQDSGHRAQAGVFAVGSLLVLIVFSEMLPKSVAVLKPRALALLLGVPLAASVRLVDPILPVLRTANLLSRRLFWPRFQPEPYLRVGDLERAVRMSTADAALIEQEQQVLQNIVLLSEIRADELMRPRTRFLAFRPPVVLADLGGRLPPSEYLLVTEPDSEEVARAIALKNLSHVPAEDLQRLAEPVAYIPWCMTTAEALETLLRGSWQVATVINEFGETIGIITLDDILDVIFSKTWSRSERLLSRAPLRQTAPGVWQASGMTTLRRLARRFQVECPPRKSVTIAGVVQEVLQRLPEPGDECRWGPFVFKVIDVPRRGQLHVELRLAEDAQEETT